MIFRNAQHIAKECESAYLKYVIEHESSNLRSSTENQQVLRWVIDDDKHLCHFVRSVFQTSSFVRREGDGFVFVDHIFFAVFVSYGHFAFQNEVNLF